MRKCKHCLWLLVFLCFLSVKTGYGITVDQNRLISVSAKNVTLNELIMKLEKETGYDFLYNNKIIDGNTKVSVDMKDKTVEEVLNTALKNVSIEYQIVDNQIILHPTGMKESAPLKQAQTKKGKISIKGTVSEFDTKEPIPYAFVVIKELNAWGTCDNDGKFVLENITPGTYAMEVSCLGYSTYTLNVTLNQDINNFAVNLKSDNLKLPDVVVTATAGSTINSSSKIEKNAIQHVQASSLADVMQLLPGSLITNPNLTSENKINIRSINDLNSNSSRGVGLMINGSKVTNDAALTLDASNGETFKSMDFRKFSTDNIESIEVLKGVLSAEYGDVTSGAILVTTKAGRTPFEVRVKSDPKTKAVSISKGFGLGKNAGNINIDADYARAFKEWISPVDIFDRTTLGITYSNTFNKEKTPLRFNVRFSGYMTKNNTTSDPDVSKLDFDKRSDKNASLSIYGNWLLNKSWISSLNYNLSGNIGSETYQKFTINSGLPVPTTDIRVSGISLGQFTGTLEERDYRSEEIPIYATAKITANLNKSINKIRFKSMLGLEFNTKGNNGRGVYYTSAAPAYFRERNYSDIPFMNDLSLFFEEKVTLPFKSTTLEVTAGARLNKMVITGYDYNPTIDPRFNGKYIVLPFRKDRTINSLSIRGGWGILQRLPSIGLLYPAPKYTDNALFLYRNATSGESLAVIQTNIVDELLPYNVKPVKTRNIELGLDINIKGIDAQFTYFNEKLTDGISENKTFSSVSYDIYNSVTDPNAAPKFEGGRVWIKNTLGEYVPLSFTTRKDFLAYDRPDNRGEINKWGIEYDINFGKIKAINTSVIVNGSYMRSNQQEAGLLNYNSNRIDPVDSKQRMPYIGIYESEGNSLGVGGGSERFSTSINFVTHIPSIRMIVSVVTQCVWMNNSWNLFDKDRVYKLNGAGTRYFGDFDKQKNYEIMYRDPDFYMDLNGTVRPFSDYYTTTDNDLKRRLAMLILSENETYYFQDSGTKPFFMANLRITKEIGNNAALSFYANNFTNSTPIMKQKNRPDAVGARKNTPIYFGAEIKLTF
ncbi:MAG: TonB-dependent receptor [Bacteroidales bacterium]|nr:TonB-dependent receptor [Bacteroidales bacterium]